MCDWQAGIEKLNNNAETKFIFRNGFSTYCNNPQLFKALGIYDQIEQDVLKDFEHAKLKYWGIPNGTEDHGYYNRSQRPTVTVTSKIETDESDSGKTIEIQNKGQKPIERTIKSNESYTEFEETIVDVSTSLEFNQKTEIEVESESSKFSATFDAKTDRKATKSYSKETDTKFTVSSGEQLVKIKNPTRTTKFKVRVAGKFCLNCAPRYKGHYLWMPQIDKVYDCQVRASDVGATTWRVEKLSDHAANVRSRHVGAE